MLTIGSNIALADSSAIAPEPGHGQAVVGQTAHLIRPWKITGTSTRLYVTDIGKCSIAVYSRNGDYHGDIGQKGSNSTEEFLYPMGIRSVYSHVPYVPDDVYVTDFHNNRIHTIKDYPLFGDVSCFEDWGKSGTGKGEMYYPSDVAYLGRELSSWPWPVFWPRIYVVDSGNHLIQNYFTDGTFIRSFGGFGTGIGEFDTPTGITIWMGKWSDLIYVTDGGNHRVQAFTPGGDYKYCWGSKGTGMGQFNTPTGIDVSANVERVYVVDNGNNRIQAFNECGVFLFAWGHKGAGEGEFDAPIGIYVSDSQNKIFVTDSGNRRVQVFDLDGQFKGIIR